MSITLNLNSSGISTISSGICTFKNLVGKAEIVLKLIGILEEDMILVDLLRLALDILIEDIHDKIIDRISLFCFL
jgi:hypothetical protein